MNWPWSRWRRHRHHRPDPKTVAAERRADELEERADAAAESLREFLAFKRDPWASQVVNTVRHGGRHAR